jgi:AraC-like DNA-binding protein
VLAAKASEPLSVAVELGEAWRLMLGTGGRVPIADLADEIGWSRRHFGERFRAEIGLAPKQAARILRFERAGALLRRGHLDLAGLGYQQVAGGAGGHRHAKCGPGSSHPRGRISIAPPSDVPGSGRLPAG